MSNTNEHVASETFLSVLDKATFGCEKCPTHDKEQKRRKNELAGKPIVDGNNLQAHGCTQKINLVASWCKHDRFLKGNLCITTTAYPTACKMIGEVKY